MEHPRYPILIALAFAAFVAAPPARALLVGQDVPPAAALQDLKDGNARFVRGEAKHEGENEAARRRLVNGQAPEAIILSCSDSRVPPETVFDQGLGRLFTIRVAGNVADPAAIASIEYAVAHLGSRLIVVMGHESCGAVKAALETPKGVSAGSRDLDGLVGRIQTNLGGRFTLASDDKVFRAAVQANADAVSKELVKRSKIVRDAVSSGRVAVVRAVYSLETGAVGFSGK